MKNESTTDLTDAITPENPETTTTIQKYALYAAAAAAGVFVVVTSVKRFTERKRVLLTVAENPTQNETPSPK